MDTTCEGATRDKHLLTCSLAYYLLALAPTTSPSTVAEIPDDAPSRSVKARPRARRRKIGNLNRKLPEEEPTPRPRVDRGEQCEQQPELQLQLRRPPDVRI